MMRQILGIIAGFAFIIFVVVRNVDQLRPKPAVQTGPLAIEHPSAAAKPTPPAFVPYAVRLTNAKAAESHWSVALKHPPVAPDVSAEVRVGWSQASSIPATAPEYAEAQKVVAAFVAHQKIEDDKIAAAKKIETQKAEAAAAKQRAIEGPKIRRALAATLEHEFLMKNMDATFTAEGAAATTLRLKFVLVGRPLVEQLRTDGKFLTVARKSGSRK